ncbi:MAG: hypothetical protein AAF318_07570 [Pseudomonadota bacterium]
MKLRFLSSQSGDLTVLTAALHHAAGYMKDAGVTATAVDGAFVAAPTDTIVHICLTDDKRSLNTNTTGSGDTAGKTQLHITPLNKGYEFEGYSEVWLATAMAKLGLSITGGGEAEKAHFVENVGTLIGALAIHEAMHMKCEAGEIAAGNDTWELHANGGGGVAAPDAGIRKTKEGKVIAPLNGKNKSLIGRHFGTPVKQIVRVA